jgi:uncharacterized SAM-dependent methyltransferase
MPPSRLLAQVLLCADLWKQRDVLHAAYCDREGVTQAFIKNGLRHAFGSLGCAAAADPDNWDYEVSACHSRMLHRDGACIGWTPICLP